MVPGWFEACLCVVYTGERKPEAVKAFARYRGTPHVSRNLVLETWCQLNTRTSPHIFSPCAMNTGRRIVSTSTRIGSHFPR